MKRKVHKISDDGEYDFMMCRPFLKVGGTTSIETKVTFYWKHVTCKRCLIKRREK